MVAPAGRAARHRRPGSLRPVRDARGHLSVEPTGRTPALGCRSHKETAALDGATLSGWLDSQLAYDGISHVPGASVMARASPGFSVGRCGSSRIALGPSCRRSLYGGPDALQGCLPVEPGHGRILLI